MEQPERPDAQPIGRRRALTRLGVGGSVVVGLAALPAKWTRPVVDRVIVPAHAQTSPTSGSEAFAYTGAPQYFTVPAGVTSITIAAVGGGGGGGGTNWHQGMPSPDGGTGSNGQTVTQSVTVAPYEQLRVVVAGGGEPGSNGDYFCTSCAGGVGGYVGGFGGATGALEGHAGGSGGGSGGTSSVYRGATVLVAAQGGTGGGGGTSNGTSGVAGADGADGGAGASLPSGFDGGDGGSGYNGANGSGTGGIRLDAGGLPGNPAASMAAALRGADGSVVISF